MSTNSDKTAGANPGAVMESTRQQFMNGFPAECAAMAGLADQGMERPTVERIMTQCHRIAGLAGMLGFPGISVKAAEIEDGLRDNRLDHSELRLRIEAMRTGFAAEASRGPDTPPPAIVPTGTSLTVLLVEDDPVQRTVTVAMLRRIGHQPIAVASGEEVLPAVRAQRPDVILMDVEMPGMGGYAACRQLKSDPDLASIPVAFLSAHTRLDDRLTGLSHGAEDFLTKPVDGRELALRLQLLNRRRPVEERATVDVLSYEAFHETARRELERDRAALALIRTPPERTADVAVLARDEVRRRDLCGEYDRSHVILLLPDTSATAARQRVAAIVEKCRAMGIKGAYAGIAASPRAGARDLESMIDEADDALAVARYENLPAALRPEQPREEVRTEVAMPMVVVADDDPDVARILDAHLGAAGYRRTLAFDGTHALEEIRAQHPDVLILDLMMPRMTGFDVLTGLRDLDGDRPRIIVLSARGREEDVVRAFTLGADDFMTKPFNPQELLARVARLVK